MALTQVSSGGIQDGAITDSDLASNIGISGSKVTPDFGSQNISTTGTITSASLIPSGSTVPSNGIYLPSSNNVSIATNSTERLRIDATGQIEAVSLGTAAAPVFSFTGDPDTGVFSPGANQLALSTNGAGRLFVDASGNIGVKTTTTTYDAAKVGSSHTFLSIQSGASSYSNVNIAGNTSSAGRVGILAFINDANSPSYKYNSWIEAISTGSTAGQLGGALLFSTSGEGSAAGPVERLRITSTGLVGVGTSTPDSYYSGANNFVVANTSGNAGITIATSTTGTGRVYFADGTSGADRYRGWIEYEHTANSLSFGSNGSERVRIDSSGRLGIGTSAPGALLDLAGGAIRLNSTHGIYKANADGYAYFSGGTGLTAGGTIFCFGESHASNANEIHFRNSSNLTRAVIDSSGRVGIGTTTPASILHCASSGDNNIRVVANGQTAQLGVDGGTPFVGTPSGAFNFYSNGQLAATLDSSRRLLVGTSSTTATARLVVQGATAGAGGGFSLQRSATDASAGSTIGFIQFTNSANNVGAAISADGDGTWSAGTSHPTRLAFSTTADGASSPTERLRITSAGRVGVGTATPGAPLDVKGTIHLSGSTSGFVGLAPAASAGSTTYTLPSADGTANQFLVTNGSGTLSWSSVATTSNGYGTRTVSTSDPSGGSDGDIWLKV